MTENCEIDFSHNLWLSASMNNTYWEHYPHPADMGIRGFGPTKENAFEQAALAMTAVIADLKNIEQKKQVEISCREDNDEMLLLSWLNAVIYEMASRKMLFSRFDVTIKDNKLHSKIAGEKINVQKHSPAVEVKAATFMDLQVKQTEDGSWMAQCIIDI